MLILILFLDSSTEEEHVGILALVCTDKEEKTEKEFQIEIQEIVKNIRKIFAKKESADSSKR